MGHPKLGKDGPPAVGDRRSSRLIRAARSELVSKITERKKMNLHHHIGNA